MIFCPTVWQCKSLGETNHVVNKFLQCFNYYMIVGIRGTCQLQFMFAGIFWNVFFFWKKKNEPVVLLFCFTIIFQIVNIKLFFKHSLKRQSSGHQTQGRISRSESRASWTMELSMTKLDWCQLPFIQVKCARQETTWFFWEEINFHGQFSSICKENF